MNDEVSVNKLIYYGIFVTVSIVLSFLISSFEIHDAVRFKVHYGLYLFLTLFILFLGIFIFLNNKTKIFDIFKAKEYYAKNFLTFAIVGILSFFEIILLYKFYTFNSDVPLEILFESQEILWSELNNLLIICRVALVSIFFIYAFSYNSKIRKPNFAKAVIFSLFHTILAIVAFFIVSIIIRIIYYAILLGTVGLTVG